MISVILTVGVPGSGKSTWAKAEIVKDPNNWVRINNDELRAMMNGSVWSQDYEKMIGDARNFLVKNALAKGKNIIIDNLNLNKRHFNDVCALVKAANVDAKVFEKTFYIEVEEAIARDAKREGKAKIGEEIIRKWWKESGKTMFKHYKPRVEVFTATKGYNTNNVVATPTQIVGAPEAIICDLDGTLALIHGRSPYDASDCDIKDLPNIPVIETVLAHYKAGRKIIFCSGREDRYRPETVRFIEKYCSATLFVSEGPMGKGFEYELHMRKTDDFRKDAIIKEEIYQAEIEGKYNVLLVLDDRTSVVAFWREKGLTCFQVAPGDF